MRLVQFFNGTHILDAVDSSPINRGIDISKLIVSSISAVSCSVIIASLILSKRTRVEGFNLYLVFLLLPDMCFNVWQLITTIVTLNSGYYPSVSICISTSIMYLQYMSSNLWMNVLVTHEIFNLLGRRHADENEAPKSNRVVMRQVFLVYVISVTVAVMLTCNTPLLDMRINSKSCQPSAHSTVGKIFVYIWLACTGVLPSIYLIYITYVVRTKRLLPNSGKFRFLAQYFMRIAIISFIFTIIIPLVMSINIRFYLGIFMLLQGFIVSLMSLAKEDIRKAVKDTMRCRRLSGGEESKIDYLPSEHDTTQNAAVLSET